MACELPLASDYPDDVAYLRAAVSALDAEVSRDAPQTAAEWTDQLRVLFRAGRYDLPLGRIFEGHVDASQLLARAGYELPAESICGVWNAEGAGWNLTASGAGTVDGGKSFASGTDVLTHALVTSCAGSPEVQIHLVDLASSPPDVDREWWSVRGMSRSRTHRVRWSDAPAVEIGRAGDYERPPWFFTGALRFVAVQAGGIAGLRDAVLHSLVERGRNEDPVQAGRLSRLHMAAQSAISVALETGRALPGASIVRQKAMVSGARTNVYAAAEIALVQAAQAVGTAAYFDGDPVAERMADLAMYIRQPGPDAQHGHVAKAMADGDLDIVA